MSPEQRLWQHVLLAILADLQSSSEQSRRDQSFAWRWVGQYPSRDFRMVCELAGVDSDSVHQVFQKIAICEQHSRTLAPEKWNLFERTFANRKSE